MSIVDLFRRNKPQPTLDEMLATISEDPAKAVQMAERKVEAMTKESGGVGPARAGALFESSTVYLATGLRERALEAITEASGIRGQTQEDEKNRLTYLLNLGEFLADGDELEMALETHERGLEERAAFYGVDHPGYAFGLSSWVDAAIALERYDEALKRAYEALEIYNAAGHPKGIEAIGQVLLASQKGKASVQELDTRSAESLIARLSRHAVRVPASRLFYAIEVVSPFCQNTQLCIQSWSRVHMLAEEQGDLTTSEAALKKILEIVEFLGDDRLLLTTMLGLALCTSKREDRAAASQWYERATELAEALGDPEELSRVLRNAGICQCEVEPSQGMALLRRAVMLAPAGGEEQGRSKVALGIQLQHQGALQEAILTLREGIACLDVSHPDTICAQSHLEAALQDKSCGCGDTEGAFVSAIEQTILQALPSDLVGAVTFEDGHISVGLKREPSEEEQRDLSLAIELAYSKFLKGIEKGHSVEVELP
jgi:tetratricopeptide (TPR) repeat protein